MKKLKIFLYVELILVFVGLPLLYHFNYIPFHKSIPLLAVFILFLVLLIRDKTFSNKSFGMNRFNGWRAMLARFFVFAVASTLAVWYFSPDYLFFLPRENISLWLLIMVFYPLWSAFPQELIYRSWYFHRYRGVFRSEWIFLFVNASLFSFSHLIFHNWLAIVLTFFGGFMFAFTYRRSQSLMAVFIEHALYGNWIFTVGIGQYFYAPTVG